MHIIPIASGKGGVGKSLAAANLAVAFAQAGKRVVLADLDLGASNLHLIIGHTKPAQAGKQTSLGAWLTAQEVKDRPPTDIVPFSSLAAETDIQNLRFIPGDAEIPGTANLKNRDRRAIVKGLRSLDCDILIIDLGAGTHQSILDFFLTSGRGIVVSTPAVTATLNAYVFLKNAVFRLMYTTFTQKSLAWQYLEQLRTGGGGTAGLYIPRMVEEIAKRDPAASQKFKETLTHFRPRLILNMLEDPRDADVGMKIRRSCKTYLGAELEHLGVIYRDAQQDTALASRLPIILYKPQSVLSQAIYRIADKILQELSTDEDVAFSLANVNADTSFSEASLEAEIDFASRREYVEELLHSGVLSEGDLLETVKTQQIEINKLKRENNFYKVKLAEAMKQGFKVR